ncbi:multiple sugar transport system substrate-binding protein/raffinose/stachyose/melibiose transport system substrate-binding protein [Hydrogenispora ethanolica]|uniref:Multiple sugar transport system substrate-binding protein/raffinose/stachyose/melibiose transport system substrate-binding protein n=1 Tax=Hydrogenispora ethanolica TaxID=1082276 RepID=A0A4R1R0I3_HYDET|nr:extracellular solute-binding protein [Hydrogenispora ethanolica]TCL58792.1 multiple sugar transport system substrate-binding protein/raffinose/stachyose/melibiose transport system substrate-binding protein [Hydrogenispora ethanolica]
MQKKGWSLFLVALFIAVSVTAPLALAAPKTLTFWHYMVDRKDLMENFAKEYEKAAGIKVDVQLFPGDQDVERKMEAAIQAGTAPDIYTTNGSGDPVKIEAKSRWIKAGGMLNLDKYVSGAWRSNYIASLLGNISFAKGNPYGVEPGLYGLPLDSVNMQFLYNKELFQKAGLNPEQPPATMTQFLAACKKLRAAGITPFAAGFGTWLGISLWEVYAWNIMGETGMVAAQNQGKRLTDPNWIKTFQVFTAMRDAGVYADGVATWDNPDAERLFAQEKCAILYDGSWGIGVVKATNPGLVPKIGAMLPPSAGKHRVYIQGGYGVVLAVNAASPNRENAVKFLEWLTAPAQQARYAKETFNLPASSAVTKQVKLEGAVGQFADDAGRIIPNILKSRGNEVDTQITRGIQSIILKQKTPKQVVQEVNRAWEAASLK